MDNFRRLIELLQVELGYQEQLLALLAKERVAIVRLNQEEIEKLSAEKNQIWQHARDIGTRRERVMVNIIGTEQKPIRLSALEDTCKDSSIRQEIHNIGSELRETAEQVQELNSHNAQLIRHSLGLISSTLSILRGSAVGDLPVYTRGGTLQDETAGQMFPQQLKSVTRQA